MTQAILPGMPAPVEYGGELEFWETPRWAVQAILPVIRERMALRSPSHGWHLIDAGCGRGPLLESFRDLPGIVAAEGVEVDPARALETRERLGDREVIHAASWFEFTPARVAPRVICSNPPFSLAVEFLERAIDLARPIGIVAFLLQHDFATGVDRAEQIHSKWRSGLYPLKRRPGFGGAHSSGKRPFSWFVFDLGNPYREWGIVG